MGHQRAVDTAGGLNGDRHVWTVEFSWRIVLANYWVHCRRMTIERKTVTRKVKTVTRKVKMMMSKRAMMMKTTRIPTPSEVPRIGFAAGMMPMLFCYTA